MNNLTINQTPFSFLALSQPTKSYPTNWNLAWITNQFHPQDTNYYLYACHSGEHIQIKKGLKSKEVLNWGGLDV